MGIAIFITLHDHKTQQIEEVQKTINSNLLNGNTIDCCSDCNSEGIDIWLYLQTGCPE